MNSELKKHLVILGFKDDIQEVPKIKDIMRMWRTKARKCHPDKPGGNTQEFQTLQEAFEKPKRLSKKLLKMNLIMMTRKKLLPENCLKKST